MAQKEIICDGRAFKISYEIKKARDSRDSLDSRDSHYSSERDSSAQDSNSRPSNASDSNMHANYALFLHGWGANKELMRGCFEPYFARYNHLYIDLPGFGNSSNDYILCSHDYARVVGEFLRVLGVLPEIIIAHSFGGKIAALLAPKKLVLLSSAGIPKNKSMQVKLKIKLAKMCNSLGIMSSIFRTKDAQNLPQNMYETLKRVVDEDFSDVFSAFSGRAWIFWGKNDDTTPLYMAHKIKSLIKGAHLEVLSGDHFFFLEHAKTIEGIVDE